MAELKPFSEYLAEAKKKSGSTNVGLNFSALKPAAKKPGDQDALSWFIDILSRPMRMIQNQPNQVLNEIQKMTEARDTGKEYDFLGGLGNVVTAGPRGLLSNNPEDQPYGAQLIEKGTDVIGPLVDPKYKDVEDNVNPIAKGIGGFALDVGSDPLTYIPGAAFAKVGKAIGSVATGAARGAVGAVAATRVGKVAQAAMAKGRIAEQISAQSRQAVDEAVEAAANQLNKAAQETPAAPPAGAKPRTKKQEKIVQQELADDLAVSQKLVENAIDTAEEATKMAAAGEKVPSFAENLAARGDAIAPLRGFSAEIQTSRNAAPAWASEEDAAQKAREWIFDIINRAKKGEKVTVDVPEIQSIKVPATKWTTEYLRNLPQTLSRTKNDKPDVYSRLVQMVQSAYKAANRPASTIEDIFASYKASNATAKAKLAEVIGPKASEQMMNMNLKAFTKATDYLAEVLSGKVDLANPAKMTSSPEKFVRAVMEHNEIEIPTIKSVQPRSESIVNTAEAVAIEEAAAKGQNLLDRPDLSDIPEENIRLIASSLTTFLDEFLEIASYPYITKGGVRRTDTEIWEGLGKRPNELNGFDQLTLFQETVRDLLQELRDIGYTGNGYRRANEIYSEMMARIADVAKWFDDRAVLMHIGVGEKKVPLNIAQMLVIMSENSRYGVENVTQMAIANLDTLVPLTNIQAAVLRVMQNSKTSTDQILKILSKPVRKSKGKPTPPNALTGEGTAKLKFGYYPFGSKRVEEVAKRSGGLLSIVRHKKGFYLMVDPKKYGIELANTIKKSAEAFVEQVAKNVDAALKREISETGELSKEKLIELARFKDDPTALANSIRQIADLQSAIIKKGTRSRVSQPAQKNSIEITESAINPQAVTSSKQAVKAESTLRNSDDASLPTKKRQAKTREAAVANSAKNIKADEKASKEALDAAKDPADGYGPDGNIDDLVAYGAALFSHVINSNISRMMNPLRNFFIAGAEALRTLPRFLAAKPTWAMGRASYQMQLRNVAAAHAGVIPGTDTTIIAQAWRNITQDMPADPLISPEIAAAEKDLLPLIQEVFGLGGKDDAIESLFLRSGGTEVDMEQYLKKAGIDFEFDLDLAKRTAKAEGISLTEAAIKQWKKMFGFESRPLEFLNDVHYAASLIVMDKAVASSLMLVPDVISTTPKRGYGLVEAGLNPLEHPFLAHIPAGTYIDAQYLVEIKRLEEFAMSNRTFSGPLGTWLNQTYTPLLNVWKKGVTIYRPGHHFRNFFSSESLQWVAEGNKYFTKSFGAAARVLAAHRSYKDIDWVQILQSYGKEIAKEGPGVTKMPKAGDVLFTSPIWGDVTVGMLYDAAQRQGLFVEFRQAEDLLDEMIQPGAVQKFSSVVGLEGTKVEDLARAVSEGQAHFNRLHHFTQILMKEAKSGKKFEDVIEAAAWKVKKHHPDSSMLAPGEAKLRAVVPFYTWFRLTLPTIAQGIATQPGRFLTFPKAFFNGAIALGVDPNSMADPFPQDQLFPSFLRDQINGPVFEFNGDYYGLNPGIAYFDVLNQFVPDPVRGALGMTTPLVKVPLELIGGTQWQTGAKIKDISDYVDSSLPGINYLANLTGYSVSGSVASILQGMGLDPQLAVSKGDKTDIDKATSLVNWLTGLGFQNMSRQSYIDLAEIEKRNKAAREKAIQEGTARSPF